MDFRRWHCYIFINCVVLYYLEAKTFSLNEAIAAESQQNQALENLPTKLSVIPERSTKRFTTKKRPTLAKLRKNRYQERTLQVKEIISPLKYKKTFQINSPLKPRKLKVPKLLRHKRKNQSVKREISGNDKLKQKYIPLLKSLSMLFDNLLNSDTSDSLEVRSKKYKRNRYYFDSEERSGEKCSCDQKTNSKITKFGPQKKTVTPTPSLTTEISIITEDFTTSEASTAATHHTTSGDFSSFRRNTNLPILFPRNTSSTRRNNNGISERSSTTYNRDTKGNIAGYYGDRKHNAGHGENESHTKSDEEITSSAARDDTRGDGPTRRLRGNRNNTRDSKTRTTADEISVAEDEGSDDDFREIKFEMGRNKTKSTAPISESIRRLRGFVSEGKVSHKPESVQPKKIRKESNFSVTYDGTNDQRIVSRSRTSATEDQKVRARDETVIPPDNFDSKQKKKSPVVMIFDGYSVTRDRNGENKLAEKSIRIHSP